GGLLGVYLWPFLRIGGMLFAIPVFGTRMMPVRIRIMLTLVLTVVIAPVLPASPDIDIISLTGVLTAIQQLLAGLVMGFVLQMVFSALVMAGEYIAMSMGLGFASLVDPANGVNVPVVSQFYVIVASLLFLALNGMLLLTHLLIQSFQLLPVGIDLLGKDAWWTLVTWGSHMFIGAVLIAVPIVSILLLAYVALGVMTRAAPQLNIFSVGFPVTLMLGFIAMLLTLEGFSSRFQQLLLDGFQLIPVLLQR
ncbi:MAG TPA: flagellar biosynthetic protein FliR, partial [Gammaproteobacteria bacterium]|nr:flagellar biosynthetic protein FliR [Gammaproteobacteria bacterium]